MMNKTYLDLRVIPGPFHHHSLHHDEAHHDYATIL